MNVKISVIIFIALFAITTAIGGYRGNGGHPGYRSYGGYRRLRGYSSYGRSKLSTPVSPVLVKTVVQPVSDIKTVEVKFPVVKRIEIPKTKKVAVPVPEIDVPIYSKV